MRHSLEKVGGFWTRVVALILAGVVQLNGSSAAAAPVELIDDGGFEGQSSFSSTSTSNFSAWRFFSSGGYAAGAVTSDPAAGARAFRLTRYTTFGDAGLDKGSSALRPFIQPGRTYRIAFRAKSPQRYYVSVRASQYDTTGKLLPSPPEASFRLGTVYQPFQMTFTAAGQSNSCDLAFRFTGGAGEMTLDEVSLTEVPSTAPAPPRVVLPAGVTTTRLPRIEWRGEDFTACEVRISSEPSPLSGIVWQSGTVTTSTAVAVPNRDLPTSTTLYTFVRVQNQFGWSPWSTEQAPFRMEPLAQFEGTLYLYDLFSTRWMSPAAAFEQAHAVSALQGLVNRSKPQLYVDFVIGPYSGRDVDIDWLEKLRAREGWLEKTNFEMIPDLPALVQRFRSSLDGVVLWDPAVPATSNVASTAAGVENLLPVRYDPAPGSVYSLLVTGGPRLPVKLNLVGKFRGTGQIPDIGRSSTGSAKCDAYLWAKARYLDTGRCSPLHLAYYIDAYWIQAPTLGGDLQNHTLTNHDYFVAEKGFFWDLSPWGDETPVDDRSQPLGTDLSTLKEILASAYARHGGQSFAHVGGFTPWAFKYTNYGSAGGTHEPVQTESETVRILSAYNAYTDADALGLSAMANASVFRRMPLPKHYAQITPSTPSELRRRGLLDQADQVAAKSYLLHYVGDYDSSAWVMNTLYPKWDASTRGSVPMAWAINPNLSQRARPFFEYAFRTRTGSDTFIGGDSGAGYVNPTQLVEPRAVSGLPSASAAWQKHNGRHYRAFDYAFTGFLLNGHAGVISPVAEAMYQSFSGDGIVNQYRYAHAQAHLEGTMPAFEMKEDLTGDLTVDAGRVGKFAEVGRADFLVFRSILQEISYYAALNDKLVKERGHEGFAFTTPEDFSLLARKHLGGDNSSRAAYLFDTFPTRWQTGMTRRVEVAVRNDGWDTWQPGVAGAPALAIEFSPDGQLRNPRLYALPREVRPGDSAVFSVDVSAPAVPGGYQLLAEMMRGTTQKFSNGGGALFLTDVEITTDPVPVTLSGFSLE